MKLKNFCKKAVIIVLLCGLLLLPSCNTVNDEQETTEQSVIILPNGSARQEETASQDSLSYEPFAEIEGEGTRRPFKNIAAADVSKVEFYYSAGNMKSAIYSLTAEEIERYAAVLNDLEINDFVFSQGDGVNPARGSAAVLISLNDGRQCALSMVTYPEPNAQNELQIDKVSFEPDDEFADKIYEFENDLGIAEALKSYTPEAVTESAAEALLPYEAFADLQDGVERRPFENIRTEDIDRAVKYVIDDAEKLSVCKLSEDELVKLAEALRSLEITEADAPNANSPAPEKQSCPVMIYLKDGRQCCLSLAEYSESYGGTVLRIDRNYYKPDAAFAETLSELA